MKAYWTDKKPDGSPITDGRLCRIVDAEDGTNPIRVYGRTEAEVFEKIERTMVTAQVALTHARTAPQIGNGTAPKSPATPAKNPAILTADEIMQYTQALQDPARSAEASERLATHHRAVQMVEVHNFSIVAKNWMQRHPELIDNNFNAKLITDNAKMRTGGSLKAITEEILEQVFQELSAGGYLLTENPAAAPGNEPTTPPVQPGGTPDPVPARPRTGVVTTTSHRSNRLGVPQLPKWQPKFSLEEINKLTTKQSAEFNTPTHPRHKDFVEACNYWFSGAQATA